MLVVNGKKNLQDLLEKFMITANQSLYQTDVYAVHCGTGKSCDFYNCTV